MIQEHAANTRWWGDRVGVLTDPAFFSLDTASQSEALHPYAWVEFKCLLQDAPPAQCLLEAGFSWVDAQLEFRIGLGRIPSSPSLEILRVRFGDQTSFTVAETDMRPFRHERFFQLPGVSAPKILERYAVWARQLIAENPAWCLQILYEDRPQGWFLSHLSERGLNLTLAMLHRDAAVSGMHLYQKALLAYAGRGARIGWASFSVANVDVHNIYARLGAHFTPPLGCWLWVRTTAQDYTQSSPMSPHL